MQPWIAPPYRLDDDALQRLCVVTWFRSGGPGGQHANRTDSAVRVVHRDTGAEAQCQDHRERGRNLHAALQRVRLRLALLIRGASQRAWLDAHRRGRQVASGANARDYPALVAVALDALDTHSGALAAGAADLGISSSQLVKLLSADKEVAQAVNALRQRFGLGVMHG